MHIMKIKQALLEIFSGKSSREVARILNEAPSTVNFWDRRSKELKLTALTLKNLSEVELEALFLQKPGPKPEKYRPVNWGTIGRILQKSTVEEAYLNYCNSPGNGDLPLLKLSGFKKRVAKWRKSQEKARRTMVQQWDPGDYVLIDYAGDKVVITDQNGEKITVRFFLGVFPYSGFVFWYATADATTNSWLESIVKMFQYVGKVPHYIKHDNDVSLMKRAEWGNPECRKKFMAMCRKYQMANSPCRVFHPRDKALAENEVGNLTRTFINTLQTENYKSLHDIRVVLREEMEAYNARTMDKRGISREELFAYEKPHLREIPDGHYQVEPPTVERKVAQNGCVTFEKHDYLMPNEQWGKTMRVGVGEDDMLQFRTLEGELICTYRHFKAGIPDEEEGFVHIKPEFREEWELTPQAMLEKAHGSFSALSDKSAEYIEKFIAHNRREEKASLASRIRWMQRSIEDAPREVIDKSIDHVLAIGSLDPQSLKACVKFYTDEQKSLEHLGESNSLSGACLRSLTELVSGKKGRTIQ